MKPPTLPDRLPILPMRTKVLFPRESVAISITRPRSMAVIESVARAEHPFLALVAQRDPSVDDPSLAQLYATGCAARLVRHERTAEGMRVDLQGLARVAIGDPLANESFLLASVRDLGDATRKPDAASYRRAAAILEPARAALARRPEVPSGFFDVLPMIAQNDPGALADVLAGSPIADVAERQAILDAVEIAARYDVLERLLERANRT